LLSDDVLLPPVAVPEILSVPLKTLEHFRAQGTPPPWIKVGHAVRYRVGVLRAWLRGAETQEPTGQATARRRTEIEGLDEPPVRRSRHRSATAFFADAASDEAWPFVRTGAERRPLDAVELLADLPDGPIEWLTLDGYAAWGEAMAIRRATNDRSTLAALVPDDLPRPGTSRRGGSGGL